MVTLKHIPEDWKYLESDAMLTGSEEIFLMKYPCKVPIIAHTFIVAFSSDVTGIIVNWQKNIIQHPYWGKIFPFQYDYAYRNLLLIIANMTSLYLTSSLTKKFSLQKYNFKLDIL